MYRKATINDCALIYDLICDMEHRELPFDRFKDIFRNQLDNRNYYHLVREQNGVVVGVLNLRFEEQLHHAGCIAEIMEFAIAHDFRNQGIGKDMLEKACFIAKEHGCLQIEVACNQLRKDTHCFYTREGMRNFHYKFSRSLIGDDAAENTIGR